MAKLNWQHAKRSAKAAADRACAPVPAVVKMPSRKQVEFLESVARKCGYPTAEAYLVKKFGRASGLSRYRVSQAIQSAILEAQHRH